MELRINAGWEERFMRILLILGSVASLGVMAGCQSQTASSSHLNLAALKEQIQEEQKVEAEQEAEREKQRARMLEAQKQRDLTEKQQAEAALERRKQRIEEIRARLKNQTLTTASVSKPQKSEAEVKKGGRYNGIIAKYAAAEGVPVKLAHAVVKVESSYRPNATGKVGEIGLMQIRLATARLMGYKGSAKALYNPETNLKWGMKYLGKARRLAGGDTCGTILKYNAGHGAKRMNKVSSKYCGRVKRILRG